MSSSSLSKKKNNEDILDDEESGEDEFNDCNEGDEENEENEGCEDDEDEEHEPEHEPILTDLAKFENNNNKQTILNDITYEFYKYNLEELYNNYLAPTKSTKINLSPPYQRQFIWSAPMQDKFIDSLINNYVLQPLILIEIKDENNNESTNYQSTLKLEERGFEFECIDGRHRLKIIKAFMEGEPINENNGHKIRYIKHEIETNIRSKKYNTIIKKNLYYTNLCDTDKQKFNKSSIPITKITIRINTKDMPNNTLLLKSILKDMFLRLQTGVKVSTIDKFRNLEEPIIEALHQNKLFMLKTYKINQHISDPTPTGENDIWSLIPEIINIPTPTKTGINTSSLTFITLFNITCLLIIQKNSLTIGSYMQINIFKAIQQNSRNVFGTTTCSEWNKHIKTLHEFLTKLYTYKFKSKSSKYYEKLKNIDKNIIYMLLYQYIKTGDTKGGTFIKYIVYIENIRKVFYNITGPKKSIFDKSPQIVIDGSDFDLFINIISDNLLCGTLNCDVNSLRKQCIDKLSKSSKISTKTK
jgi:hypothetical protein